MSRHSARASLPPVWLGPGAVSDPRALVRFGDLRGIPVAVGPVLLTGPSRAARSRPCVRRLGVGGLEHYDAPGLSCRQAEELLTWCAARGLSVSLALRAGAVGELAEVVGTIRRHLDADALRAVEVDLRGADDQQVLRTMSRVREAAPRGTLLLCRLSAGQADLVAAARSAVAGGAGGIVVCGAVPLGEGAWWSGPSTVSSTRAGVRALRTAEAELRWPGALLIAAGGVHGTASLAAVRRDGADAVQLGTALWADPTLLFSLTRASLRAEDGPAEDGGPAEHAPPTDPDEPTRPRSPR